MQSGTLDAMERTTIPSRAVAKDSRVQRFTPLLADAAGPCRHSVGARWFMDETYVKVSGRWRDVYRAIDQYGQIIDVCVSARGDTRGAPLLHDGARRDHGRPEARLRPMRGFRFPATRGSAKPAGADQKLRGSAGPETSRSAEKAVTECG